MESEDLYSGVAEIVYDAGRTDPKTFDLTLVQYTVLVTVTVFMWAAIVNALNSVFLKRRRWWPAEGGTAAKAIAVAAALAAVCPIVCKALLFVVDALAFTFLGTVIWVAGGLAGPIRTKISDKLKTKKILWELPENGPFAADPEQHNNEVPGALNILRRRIGGPFNMLWRKTWDATLASYFILSAARDPLGHWWFRFCDKYSGCYYEHKYGWQRGMTTRRRRSGYLNAVSSAAAAHGILIMSVSVLFTYFAQKESIALKDLRSGRKGVTLTVDSNMTYFRNYTKRCSVLAIRNSALKTGNESRVVNGFMLCASEAQGLVDSKGGLAVKRDGVLVRVGNTTEECNNVLNATVGSLSVCMSLHDTVRGLNVSSLFTANPVVANKGVSDSRVPIVANSSMLANRILEVYTNKAKIREWEWNVSRKDVVSDDVSQILSYAVGQSMFSAITIHENGLRYGELGGSKRDLSWNVGTDRDLSIVSRAASILLAVELFVGLCLVLGRALGSLGSYAKYQTLAMRSTAAFNCTGSVFNEMLNAKLHAYSWPNGDCRESAIIGNQAAVDEALAMENSEEPLTSYAAEVCRQLIQRARIVGVHYAVRAGCDDDDGITQRLANDFFKTCEHNGVSQKCKRV